MVALLRSSQSQNSMKTRLFGCSCTCVSVNNSNDSKDSNDSSLGDPLLRRVYVSVPVFVCVCVYAVHVCVYVGNCQCE